ncbi:MAG: MlaD family protein [Mariprofundus sp.]|nr:MlaD family protein [Mariprofundus sp.]
MGKQDSHTEMAGDGQPVVKMPSRFSMVWLIPVLTLCIGLWLIVKTISEQGPEITISMKTADGIEAGKTPIKYKDVKIGMVEALKFTKDFKHVVLTARLNPDAESFLHRDTLFWVVRPQLSLRGVSGLGTLVSGSYIEIDPGHGSPQYHFKALDSAPIVKSDSDGVRVTLLSDKLGSLDVGSPIYYQGIQAGEVLGYELSNDKHSIFVHAFVRSPYDGLVHGNSHIWNVSGIDLTMGADGVQLRTTSLQSMLYGGIAFDSQKKADSPLEDAEDLVFTLYKNYDEIIAKTYTRKIRFVVYFEKSVRGLNVNAPVEFKGIQVGKVVDVRLEFNRADVSFRIPVIIEIEPERIVENNEGADSTSDQILASLVARGLRAQLETGSLLTGKLFVSLDMHPDTPIRLLADGRSELPEIPSIAGGFDQITTSLQSILTKLDKVKTDKIGEDLASLVHSSNNLINGSATKESIADLRASLSAFRHVIESLDQHAEPMADNLDKALNSGRSTLEQAEKTLRSINDTLDPASPLQYRVNQLSQDLSDMARAIRSFVDLLERHPNAVLFGKPKSGEQ